MLETVVRRALGRGERLSACEAPVSTALPRSRFEARRCVACLDKRRRHDKAVVAAEQFPVGHDIGSWKEHVRAQVTREVERVPGAVLDGIRIRPLSREIGFLTNGAEKARCGHNSWGRGRVRSRRGMEGTRWPVHQVGDEGVTGTALAVGTARLPGRYRAGARCSVRGCG